MVCDVTIDSISELGGVSVALFIGNGLLPAPTK